MKFWVGVTDNRWYDFVATRAFDEVNFWRPSSRPPFSTLPIGTPFLFKLKRPHNHLVGGGYFVRYTRLPLATAWDVFGEQNGARSLTEFRALIASNRSDPVEFATQIGCVVLTNVFHIPRERWIDAFARFPPNVVTGSTYDTAAPDALALWNDVTHARTTGVIAEVPQEQPRFGRPFLAHARLGQGSFRTLVIDAYGRKCAATGESTLPALEAAHIRSYAEEGPHSVSNGLLLRSDFHRLFDAGLVTVEPDYRIRISGRIRDQYFNGKAYYRLNGQELAHLPEHVDDLPNPEYLRWHNEARFVE